MTTNPNLDDEQITALSDTLYDALYAITPLAEPHFADETEGLKNAVRAVLAEFEAQGAPPAPAEDSHESAVEFGRRHFFGSGVPPQAEQPDRIADSEILRAAPDNTDEWSDEAWAAWHRVAERAHTGRNGAPRA
ncbi:hypothetical protein ACFV10_28530 [Streptomyces cyaneofuscatus]|uniref:hypothetical protein n=1 Tax=Streptomyces cyaneofuscatus TaxID=66883 RepID=UPI00367A738D